MIEINSPRIWLILLLFILQAPLNKCQVDGEKCSFMTIMEPSSHPPLEFDQIMADIEKIEQSSGSSAQPQPGQSSTSSPGTSSSIHDYATCTLSGDKNALQGAINAASDAKREDFAASVKPCKQPTHITNQKQQQTYNQCKLAEHNRNNDLRQQLTILKDISVYTMRKQECPHLMPYLKNKTRKIFPSDATRESIIIEDGSLETLLEYLSEPDFQFNLCFATDVNIFPICTEELGCGYLKASAIDYPPYGLVDLVQNICIYIKQGIASLQKHTEFRNDFELVELSKDCENSDFFKSFQCLSVDVSLRRRLQMYLDWYQKEKDMKLKPYLKEVRVKMKKEVYSLQNDLSKRFHFKIPKKGDDCSGSIDFGHILNQTLEYFLETPDGRLPFEFLRRIPIAEREVVELVKKTCDVSQDFVCGKDCVCVCPEGEWRTCNGRAGRLLSSTWTLPAILYVICYFFAQHCYV